LGNKGLLRIGAIAAVLLIVIACGDDDDGAATSLSVEADSFSFSPDSYTVAADTDVSVSLENVSDVDEHEWVIVKLGSEISSEADFDEEDVLFEVEAVPPGTTESGTFNIPAGEYQIICALEGHFEGGMEGTLVAESN